MKLYHQPLIPAQALFFFSLINDFFNDYFFSIAVAVGGQDAMEGQNQTNLVCKPGDSLKIQTQAFPSQVAFIGYAFPNMQNSSCSFYQRG